MSCPRCTSDRQPAHFGNERRCAFDAQGHFTPDNWACASLAALVDNHLSHEQYGCDESMQLIAVSPEVGYSDGWLVLSHYKMRGCVSSATWVGDFWPPRPVTLELVQQILGDREWPSDWLEQD